MIDFTADIEKETTLFHLVLFFIIYLTMIVRYRKVLFSKGEVLYPSGWKNNIPFLLCCLFLIIAAFNRGDFFHYFDIVKNFNSIPVTHMERFYEWLIVALNSNYLLWRIVVWGGAFLLFLLTAKRMNLNSVLPSLVLFACFINCFNYSRFSLACAVYFWGLSFILRPIGNKILSYILGGALILSCQFFHSSTSVLIIITPVIWLPYSKQVIILAIILTPIILKLLPSYIMETVFFCR